MKNIVTKAILKKCNGVSRILKSLSHPVRLKVICQVIDQKRNVNQLTEFCGISQSAMSQFLSRMKAEGILTSQREGTHIIYSIANPKLFKLLCAIKEIYC